nr:MAG TPA: hypothetical protein [Caudoviricetes sp.]
MVDLVSLFSICPSIVSQSENIRYCIVTRLNSIYL